MRQPSPKPQHKDRAARIISHKGYKRSFSITDSSALNVNLMAVCAATLNDTSALLVIKHQTKMHLHKLKNKQVLPVC